MSQTSSLQLGGSRPVPTLRTVPALGRAWSGAFSVALLPTVLALGCSVLACSAGGTSNESHITTDPAGYDGPPRVTDSANSGVVGTSASSNQQLFNASDVTPVADDTCSGKLPVVYRDFSQAHPDFEMAFSGDVVRRQLIGPTLGADHTPTFLSSTGCPWKQNTPTACDTWKVDKPVITSAASFAQWYHDTPNINVHFEKTLELTETPPGSGTYAYSSSSFFPLTNDEGFGITPPGQSHNFLFTTELHLVFQYIGGQKFQFRGDDDMWIFVNNHIALDLGSMHAAADGTIDFDAQATDLQISPGNAYAMDIFHAERHTSASNFSVQTNIACFTPAAVH